jgi:uncharacterized membrane protein YgdD (TMEM256/DUF423 family)
MSLQSLVSTGSLAYKCGAVSGGLAVLLGAFGAHALSRHTADPKAQSQWATAASYHLVHSVALLAASAHRSKVPALLFGSGIAIFSGSLYALVLSGEKRLGAVTPIGGLLLTAGWFSLLL